MSDKFPTVALVTMIVGLVMMIGSFFAWLAPYTGIIEQQEAYTKSQREWNKKYLKEREARFLVKLRVLEGKVERLIDLHSKTHKHRKADEDDDD